MFFGLVAIDDHPCCNMQEVVESFFLCSIEVDTFSLALFPDWMQSTVGKGSCTLGNKFKAVHALLHAEGIASDVRQAIYEQLKLTNRIEALCDGTAKIPDSVIDLKSELGKAIADLMSSLYESLDLAVFRRKGQTDQPTHQLYGEFIKKNKYICPFCGIEKFKNRKGARREDFDHYLHKSNYPLAAANMRNLVPTCGTCNQDYKKTNDILADGSAFYPYAAIPEVKVEVVCNSYPAPENLDDRGSWVVHLDLIEPDAAAIPKLNAWDRVYFIKKRLADEVEEFFEEWMKQVSDDHPYPVEQHEFIQMITSARDKAAIRSTRREEPRQIVRAAFYDFMITKAEISFVDSFRHLLNRSYV